MIPCNTLKRNQPKVVASKIPTATFTVEDVKEQIPSIRKQLSAYKKEMRLGKVDYTREIRKLVVKRHTIMSNLPKELEWMKTMHGADIVGFESSLEKHCCQNISKAPTVIRATTSRSCKCQAITKKGTQCTRNAIGGKYCKMHS